MRRRRCSVIVALALLAPAMCPALPAARGAAREPAKPTREQKLIAVLKSNAPLFARARACQQLAVVGGKDAVDVLARLLGDESLGDYARFALEAMPGPRVDDALREAMGKLTGRLLAGVVNSIGVRHDAKAAGALRKLAGQPEKGAAREALAALGRIATGEAVEALCQALTSGPAKLRPAAADACLAAAQRLAAGEKNEAAADLCDTVRKADVAPHVRAAATHGAILARGPAGLPLLLEQLKSPDRAMVRVALLAARRLPGRAVSEKLTAELAGASPAVQAPLIGVLADRKDLGARRGIAALAGSKTLAVRLASLEALGRIGDAEAVPVLLKAAGAAGEEAAVARRSLRTLDAKGADAAILAGLTDARGALRAELIAVLSDRRHTPATAALLREAAGRDDSVARAAFKALGVLAGPKDLPALVKLLVASAGRAAAGEAENAVVLVAGKLSRPDRRADAVLAALASTDRPAARAALLGALGRVGGAKAYQAVVKATGDADAAVKDAAVRALSGWPDGRAEEALLGIIDKTTNATHRVLAVRGYLRLLGLATGRSAAETAAKYAAVMGAARRAGCGKLALAGLAGVPHGDALKLAMQGLADAATASEAAAAAVQIARAITATDPKSARSAMQRLLTVSKGKRIAAAARQVIAQIDRFADSVTAWRIAGPFAKEGATYARLFDVAFEPEKPGAKGVAWRAIPAGTDPKRPWILDLLKAIGGQQRVAYALTWIHSASAQPARIELGSDDGVKVWLNGRLVHAHNVARAAEAYTDKADVTLKAGWNCLLVKVTQNVLGWEFCVRVCGRDGRALGNVRVDAGHEGDWRVRASGAKGR